MNISYDGDRKITITHDDGTTTTVRYRSAPIAQQAKAAMEHLDELGPSITFAEFYEVWKEHYAKHELAEVSHKVYYRVLDEHVIPIVGHIPIPDIDRDALAMFVDKHLAEGRSRRSVWTALTIISAVLGVAVSWRYIDENPVDLLDLFGLSMRPRELDCLKAYISDEPDAH